MKTLGVLILALGAASQAPAHFLWAEFRPEGGRHLALTFGEGPNQDLLPIMGRLTPKTTVVNEKVGAPKIEGNVAAYPLARPTTAALVYLPYGVVERGGAVYGLDYWAKAVQSPTDAARPVGKGFEIVAVPKGNVWRVSAYLDGKPCPDAQVVSGDDTDETRAPVGATMEVPIVAGQPLKLRATREIAKPGKIDGKAFKTTRVWTSIAIPAGPMVTEGSDPDAYRALQMAVEARETVRPGSAPWTVDFTATNGQDSLKGNAAWEGQGAAKVTFPGDENSYTKHVRGQLASLFMHRMGRPFGEGDGKSVIVWTDDVNELGRKVVVRDMFDSSYRLKDGKIRQVVRTIGKGILTLDILETKGTANGQYLTTKFRSIERDKATGAIRSELMYTDEFRLENGDWLPASRKLKGTAGGDRIEMAVAFGPYRKLDKTVK